MKDIQIETNPERLAAQEAHRSYLASRKVQNINCSYTREVDENGQHFRCFDCLYWDGRKCCSVAFPKDE